MARRKIKRKMKNQPRRRQNKSIKIVQIKGLQINAMERPRGIDLYVIITDKREDKNAHNK